MYGKRFLSCLVLFCYLLLSQFIVKAWVSTDFSLYSQEDFCMTKKLDTFEAKWSCWNDHNTADTTLVYDFLPENYIYLNKTITNHIFLGENKGKRTLDILGRAQAPPWITYARISFLETYIGSHLLLT